MSPRPDLAARRKALGHSQESLAGVLDVRSQSVARWEQGTSTPLARHRRPLAEALEISLHELECLINGQTAPPTAGHAVPPWLDHYASLEQAAGRLQTFEPISIPGLLQTRDYAQAVMEASHRPVSSSVVQARVRARIDRQAVLVKEENPLELVAVIDESALHRTTGSTSVMAEQLRHLCDAGRQPNVCLQIVPATSAGLHCASFGSFRLFTSLGATSPFMTCTEDLTGFTYIDRSDAIAAHAELFEHLQTIALTSMQSADLIRTTAETYSHA